MKYEEKNVMNENEEVQAMTEAEEVQTEKKSKKALIGAICGAAAVAAVGIIGCVLKKGKKTEAQDEYEGEVSHFDVDEDGQLYDVSNTDEE